MTVSVDNISFGYPNHNVLFSGVTFTVARGQAAAVVGTNGSGKTTLLRIIAGAMPPCVGRVTLDSRTRVMLLPTNMDHFLLPWYSVRKNMAFFKNQQAAPSNGDRRGELGLINDFFPDFAEQALSREVYKLSTGEKAIIGYACAMETKPDLLVLDELFGNLSAALRPILIQEIRSRLAGGLSIVFTSHDSGVIDALADKTITLT